MLLATAHWDGYTVFSVISGVILVLMNFTPGLKPGIRITCLVVGIAMAAYGIYVANQTSGTFFFPVYIFVVPVIAVAAVFKAFAGNSNRRPGGANQLGNRPIARPVATNQAVANASYPTPATAEPRTTNSTAATRAVTSATGVNPSPPPSPMQAATPVTPNSASHYPQTTLPEPNTGPPLPARPLPGQKIVIELQDLGDA
jgi:hypothetical protein